MSALVHGYAGKGDLALMVNAFHLQVAGLKANVYFDWVPSKANIADLPSRPSKAANAQLSLALRGFDSSTGRERLVIPDVASYDAPLSSWLARGNRSGFREHHPS